MEISPMTFAAILAEKIGEPEIENSKLLPELNLKWSYFPETPEEKSIWMQAMSTTLSNQIGFSTHYDETMTLFHLYELMNMWSCQVKYYKVKKQKAVLPAYFATIKDIVHILNQIFKDGPEYMMLDWLNEKFDVLLKG